MVESGGGKKYGKFDVPNFIEEIREIFFRH